MERLPNDGVLKYNPDTLEAVRKMYGLHKPGAMENAVHILEEWVKKQHHFTNKRFNVRYLETTIINSKGSIEKAKARLDRACTLRTLLPHLAKVHDIRDIFETYMKDVHQALLPKMTKNHKRVTIHRCGSKMLKPNTFSNYILTFSAFGEYVKLRDYAASHHFVVDYVDADLLEIAKHLTLNELQEAVAYALDCCGFCLKGLYLISSSKFIGSVVIFKKVIHAKLGDRIHVLSDRESLTEIFDPDILPKEYGGNEKTLAELQVKDLIDAITSKEHEQYLNQIFSTCTDETKRVTGKFNDKYMGMPGSFRKLNVD